MLSECSDRIAETPLLLHVAREIHHVCGAVWRHGSMNCQIRTGSSNRDGKVCRIKYRSRVWYIMKYNEITPLSKQSVFASTALADRSPRQSMIGGRSSCCALSAALFPWW
jgi:hypothetical protein